MYTQLNLTISFEIIKGLTNRQLINDYRLTIKELNTITDLKERGSNFYLGDNIYRRELQEKRSLRRLKQELLNRGYKLEKLKNIPELKKLQKAA